MLTTTLKNTDDPIGIQGDDATVRKLIGKRGKSISELYPSGQIEIDGHRYDAKSNLGKIAKGEIVEVIKISEFELLVRLVET